MAQFPTVRLDPGKTLDYDRTIPSGVRASLRSAMPGILRDLGAKVEQILNTELQSRRRLKVSKTIREDRSGVYGQISLTWTGDATSAMVPQIIETGAKAHAILPKNAKALSFLWPRMGGGRFFFKKVWHPGYPGIHPVQRAYTEMQPEINDRLFAAVANGIAANTLTLAPGGYSGIRATETKVKE